MGIFIRGNKYFAKRNSQFTFFILIFDKNRD